MYTEAQQILQVFIHTKSQLTIRIAFAQIMYYLGLRGPFYRMHACLTAHKDHLQCNNTLCRHIRPVNITPMALQSVFSRSRHGGANQVSGRRPPFSALTKISMLATNNSPSLAAYVAVDSRLVGHAATILRGPEPPPFQDKPNQMLASYSLPIDMPISCSASSTPVCIALRPPATSSPAAKIPIRRNLSLASSS